jgi:hypothetical protein
MLLIKMTKKKILFVLRYRTKSPKSASVSNTDLATLVNSIL